METLVFSSRVGKTHAHAMRSAFSVEDAVKGILPGVNHVAKVPVMSLVWQTLNLLMAESTFTVLVPVSLAALTHAPAYCRAVDEDFLDWSERKKNAFIKKDGTPDAEQRYTDLVNRNRLSQSLQRQLDEVYGTDPTIRTFRFTEGADMGGERVTRQQTGYRVLEANEYVPLGKYKPEPTDFVHLTDDWLSLWDAAALITQTVVRLLVHVTVPAFKLAAPTCRRGTVSYNEAGVEVVRGYNSLTFLEHKVTHLKDRLYIGVPPTIDAIHAIAFAVTCELNREFPAETVFSVLGQQSVIGDVDGFLLASTEVLDNTPGAQIRKMLNV
jgi:hypothetical protein